MDLEARSMPPGIKALLLAKIREYRNDLNILKSETKRLHSSNANLAERDELSESGRADVSADQRGRLMMSTERLNKSTNKVEEGRRTILETGISIMKDLHQQRQSLLHAKKTVIPFLSFCSM
ncbi:vesicle transport v-SNARE 13-like protein [Tanacetum coccineum]